MTGNNKGCTITTWYNKAGRRNDTSWDTQRKNKRQEDAVEKKVVTSNKIKLQTCWLIVFVQSYHIQHNFTHWSIKRPLGDTSSNMLNGLDGSVLLHVLFVCLHWNVIHVQCAPQCCDWDQNPAWHIRHPAASLCFENTEHGLCSYAVQRYDKQPVVCCAAIHIYCSLFLESSKPGLPK